MSKKTHKFLAATAAAAIALTAILPGVQTVFAARVDSSAMLAESDPYAALEVLKETENAENVREEYRLIRTLEVAYGKVYKFQQVKNGCDVFGGQVNVSIDKEGAILSVNGGYRNLNSLKSARLSEEAACAAAQTDGDNILSVEEIIYAPNSTAPLPAYEIITDANGGTQMFVSAINGEVLLSAPLTSGYKVTTKQTNFFGNEVEIDIEYDGKNYVLADLTRNIFAYDAQNSEMFASTYSNQTGVFDAMAVSVFYNTIQAYDFYTDENNIGTKLYGINGGNDDISGNCESRVEEIPIKLMIHYGKNFENAAFGYSADTNEGTMYVGDGNTFGTIYHQGAAQDVIAHEYQHGVTEFAADLVYENESGALNEAFSDIFGALVEGYDPSDERFWLIGEDACSENKEGLRSLKDPIYPQRSSMANKYICGRPGYHAYHSCDNGGVHYNSTIISHVQYKIWEKMPEYFTRERIGKLWYATLCMLTSNSTFADFGLQFLQMAYNLSYDREACHVIRECLEDSGIISSENVHVVTFVNLDGAVLKEDAVPQGGSVTPPEEPTLEPTQQFTFTFKGWDGTYDNITKDMIITALYDEILRSYTVRFLDGDGAVIKEELVLYGNKSSAPEITQSYESGHYLYEFTGWNVELSAITDDTVYSATYRTTPLSYTVTYFSESSVYHRETLIYQDAIPLPEPTSFFKIFDGWYLDRTLTRPAENAIVESNMYLYASWKPDVTKIALLCGGCVVAFATVGGLTTFLILRRKKK